MSEKIDDKVCDKVNGRVIEEDDSIITIEKFGTGCIATIRDERPKIPNAPTTLLPLWLK